MSAAPGLETPAPRPRPGPRSQPLRRPPLALVPTGAARRRASRTPFAAVVVALLAAGLLGLLVLNTALAQDAFLLHTLKQDSRALEDREQVLTREVEALQAPQSLATRASELGMVPAGPPAFLRLPDGAVLGAETAAEVPELAGSPESTPESTPEATPGTSAESTDGTAGEASADAGEAPVDGVDAGDEAVEGQQ